MIYGGRNNDPGHACADASAGVAAGDGIRTGRVDRPAFDHYDLRVALVAARRLAARTLTVARRNQELEVDRYRGCVRLRGGEPHLDAFLSRHARHEAVFPTPVRIGYAVYP